MPADGPAAPRRHVYVLTALIAAVYASIAWQSGVRISPDSVTYSRWADQLIAHHFNLRSYLHEQSFVVPPLLYLLWIVVVAAMKTALGSHWMVGIVVGNWLALVIGARATIAAAWRLTRSNTAVVVATGLFLCAGDLMIFVPFVLSDLMFWAMSTTVVALGVSASVRIDRSERNARWRTICGTVLVAVALAFRPAGVPLLAFWMLALAVIWRPALIQGRESRLFAALLLVAMAAITVHAYLLLNLAAWPSGNPPAMLALLAHEYRDGVLVYSPNNDMLVHPAEGLGGFIRLTFQKWVYFFTPWLSHYSTFHVLINAAFFVPAYGLSIVAIMGWRRLPRCQRTAIWLAASHVVLVSLFHALMQIEYDHRYRLPLLPAMLIMSAIGWTTVSPRRTPASTAPAK